MVNVLGSRCPPLRAAAAVVCRIAIATLGPRARPWLVAAGIAVVVAGVAFAGSAAAAARHHTALLPVSGGDR